MVEGRGARWWRLVAGATLAAATAAAWPSVAAGAHDLADETLPPVPLPAVTLPPVTLPPVSTPGLTTPAVSTPIAEVPSVPVPSVTLPPLAVGGGVEAPDAAPVAATVPLAVAGETTGQAPVGELPGTSAPGSAGPPSSGVPTATAAPAVASSATEMRPLGVRLRQAAAETVGRLSFPLGLAVAIACFLLVQHRLDRGDPRMAPVGPADDELLEFS